MKDKLSSFEELLSIVEKLRSPSGCPWDRKQTPFTMRENLEEETYECIHAINENNIPHIQEELGDLFLLLTMISYMYEQQEHFSVKDVLKGISSKLIRRHPHVFGSEKLDNADKVIDRWNQIKETTEGKNKRNSFEEKALTPFPPLKKAIVLQKEAAKHHFDAVKIDDMWDKIYEELEELKAENTKKCREEELGDILFSVVNVSRHLGIDPSTALGKANSKFANRFTYVMDSMEKNNISFSKDTLKEMDSYWNEAKQNEKNH